jgi:hypothetical protein
MTASEMRSVIARISVANYNLLLLGGEKALLLSFPKTFNEKLQLAVSPALRET